MLPLGAERAAKVAFRRGPATAMPRQFGPISRAPWARTSASSCSCRSAPSLPTSAKPGRDDDERPHAVAERVLGGGEHVLARDRDHREVDRIRDLRHRRVAANARDRARPWG